MNRRLVAAVLATGVLAAIWAGSAAAHPVVETWGARTNMPLAREGTAGAFIGGRFYVSHGSLAGAAGPDSALMASYDPATDTWATHASAIMGRAELVGAAVGGIFYAIGGRNKAIGNPCGTVVCNTVEAYNPATNTWTTKASMPTARAGAGAAVVGGKIYVAGGRTGKFYADCCELATLEIYDPATNTWSTGPSMPTARGNVYSTVAIGSKIYVIGGFKATTTTVLPTVEIYDVAAGTWSTGPAMPTARLNAGAGVCRGHVYVFGGTKIGSTRMSVVEEFDPSAGTWSAAPAMPSAASEMAAGSLSLATSPGGDGIIMATGSGVFGDTLDQNLIMSCEQAVVMEGRATGIALSSPAGDTIIADAGPVSTTGAGTTETQHLDMNQAGIRLRAPLSRVITGAKAASAESSMAEITVDAGGTTITARGIRTTATATCAGSAGSITLAYLKVGSNVLIDGPVSPDPNTQINAGAARVVLNEVSVADTPTSHSREVRAIVVTAGGVVVRLGTARAGVHTCPS